MNPAAAAAAYLCASGVIVQRIISQNVNVWVEHCSSGVIIVSGFILRAGAG